MRQAQPNGGHTKRHGVPSRGAHGVRFLRRRVFLERRGSLARVADGVGARRVFLERRPPPWAQRLLGVGATL